METEKMGWLRDVEDQLRSWEEFYHEFFGFKENFSGTWVPVRQPDFSRLIAVPGELTAEWIFSALKKSMSVEKYLDSLDVVASARKVTQKYVVLVRDRQEADEEFQNLSPCDLLTKKVNCITLEERLLLELKYFTETRQGGQAGKHLDEQNATLCAGSIDLDNCVPVVRCYGNRLIDIDGVLPSIRADFLRGRQVIS